LNENHQMDIVVDSFNKKVTILSIQSGYFHEVAKLRWNGAIDLIRGKGPESDNERMQICSEGVK